VSIRPEGAQTSVPFLFIHPFVSIFYVIKNKITSRFTELSTRNLPEGKGRLELKAHILTAICEPTAYKMWEP
jgi:hypothetical protein